MKELIISDALNLKHKIAELENVPAISIKRPAMEILIDAAHLIEELALRIIELEGKK